MSDPVIAQTGTTLIALITGAAVAYGWMKISTALNPAGTCATPKRELRRRLKPHEKIVVDAYAPDSKINVHIEVEHLPYLNPYKAIESNYGVALIITPHGLGEERYNLIRSVGNIVQAEKLITTIIDILRRHGASKDDCMVVRGDIAWQFSRIDFENAHFVAQDRYLHRYTDEKW